ncbi:MAG: ATP-binding protein, partial [Streptococcus vestibularis]
AMTPLNADQMDLLKHFQKGIAQVDAYVKELSELNKMSLKKTLSLEDISVREFVEDIFDQTLSLAQIKQINVAFDKKEIEKESIGNWDKSLLNRAIMNIVSNAVEHTPSGSHLLLTARVEEDEFKFICLDSGPGFSLESLEKATQLFYQEDKSRQSRSHSGLGLTIANDIIRLHHGSLSLSNDNGTGGAKVTIILPL